MKHRLVLFKWLVREEKEVLDIVEHPFDSLEEAVDFLDASVAEAEYDLAKVFLGDALMHSRDRKRHHHCDFS